MANAQQVSRGPARRPAFLFDTGMAQSFSDQDALHTRFDGEVQGVHFPKAFVSQCVNASVVPPVRVARFLIDDRNEEKFWNHGILAEAVISVLRDRFVLVNNRSGRAAPLLLIGRDAGGRCIAIPIVSTTDPLVWRPVTAWSCKDREAAVLRERSR